MGSNELILSLYYARASKTSRDSSILSLLSAQIRERGLPSVRLSESFKEAHWKSLAACLLFEIIPV